MKPSRLATLAVPIAFALACGGAGQDAASSFQSAAPSYAALALDVTASDTSAPALADAPSAGAQGVNQAVLADDPCHPHLFVRTHDTAARVNRHLWRALRHVEDVIQQNPSLATGGVVVWERVLDGIDVKFTVTRDGDVYTWKLEMEKVGAAAFSTVVTGSIDRSQATGPHQGSGDLTIDLGALASVTGEPVAGVLAAHFETFAASRLLVVDAKDVIWDTETDSVIRSAPRSAHYVYDREPGKGGSLKIEEQMVFACPTPQTTPASPADVKLVSRWYRTAAGPVHGRSDALMVGGQLPSLSIAQVVGVTCHSGSADGADQAESYWLMKAEDANGGTIAGASHESATATASACDSVFGAVPTLADASNDFDFTAVDFADANPFPFPGM